MDENLINQILKENEELETNEVNATTEDVTQDINRNVVVHDVSVERESDEAIDISESMGWVSGDIRYHDSLLGVDSPNQHPITAIGNLREELDEIKRLKTVYSDKFNVANYYEWNDAAYDEYGYFVSVVPGTSKVEICGGSDIFGVVVDSAAFVGGQDTETSRDNSYGLIVTSGIVDVRCELDIDVGEYVTSNIYGCAKKSESNYGYKVLARENKNGVEYAVICLGVQADTISKFGIELSGLQEQVNANYANIISAVNIANQAYNKTSEIDSLNKTMSHKVDAAVGKVDSMVSDVENLTTQISNSTLASAQAKAIAESAATSAESMRNEAVEEANKALTATSELRIALDDKIAEIDEELDNTILELEETKQTIDATIDELQSNMSDVSDQLNGVKTDLNDTLDKLYADVNNTKDALNTTKDQLWSSINSTSSELNKTQEGLMNTISDIEELHNDLIPLTTWSDEEHPTGVAGFVAKANENSVALGAIVTWKDDANNSMAAFKQEVSDNYATIESLASLQTETSESIANFKQEVERDYATQEMVSSVSNNLTSYTGFVANTYATQQMLTGVKDSLTLFKQEATDTYATQEMVSNIDASLTDFKQEAKANYATQEMVSSVDNALSDYKQEVLEGYATQQMVTGVENNLSSFQQEVKNDYATLAMVAAVDNSLASYKQEVKDNYATQEMVSSVSNNLTSYTGFVANTYATQQMLTEVKENLVVLKQEVENDYATQQMITIVSDNLAEYQQEVGETYATIDSVTHLKTETSDALTAFKQDTSATYATIESLASLRTEASESIANFKQEVERDYATQEMVSSVSNNLTSYTGFVANTYATQQMLSTVEGNLTIFRQEVEGDYATQQMVTKVSTDMNNALSDYKQEVGTTYATNTSLANLKTETTNAIAASEEKATETYASKDDLTSFESNANISMARIEQKADDNGAYMQSMVSNMDKYSVGPHSQAYGFTRSQAQSVLEPGMIYVPTENEIAEEYLGEGDLPTYRREFAQGYLYRWGEVPDGYGWITIDKDYSEDKLNTSDPAVYFSTTEPSVSGEFGYWYTNGDTVVEGYKPYTLYKWESYVDENDVMQYHWVTVATLAGNSQSRAVSQIRQDANSVVTEVTNARGDAASLSARLTETDSRITLSAAHVTELSSHMATIEQKADKNSASIGLLVTDGSVDGSLVIGAINGETFAKIDADRLDIEGKKLNIKVDATNIDGALTIGQLPDTVAKKSDIKTKTSELINDSGFQNETGVTTIIDGRITADYIETLNLEVGKQVTVKGDISSFGATIGGWTIDDGEITSSGVVNIETKNSYGETVLKHLYRGVGIKSYDGLGSSKAIYVSSNTENTEFPFYIDWSGSLRAENSHMGGLHMVNGEIFNDYMTIGGSDCAEIRLGQRKYTIEDYSFDNMIYGIYSSKELNRIVTDINMNNKQTVYIFGKIFIQIYEYRTEKLKNTFELTPDSGLFEIGKHEGYLSFNNLNLEINEDYLIGRVSVGFDYDYLLKDNCLPFVVQNNGHVIAYSIETASSATTSSDASKKHDIEPLGYQYDDVFDALVPRRFKYNNGTSDRYHTGFIVQEVESALLSAGVDSKDFAALCIAEDGNSGLRYDEFVALNTDQIQKLKARVTELEDIVTKLQEANYEKD